MTEYRIFSKRNNNEPIDVFVYNKIGISLRNQIWFIIEDMVGNYYESIAVGYGDFPDNNNEVWINIRKFICTEFGVENLSGLSNHQKDCEKFLKSSRDVDRVLDLVEVFFRWAVRWGVKYTPTERQSLGIVRNPADAVDSLNRFFREAGVGYQFERDLIIRVDSDLAHAEVTIPALQLLRDPRFKGVDEEFRAAHKSYQAGDYKESVTSANSAFESTIKSICAIKGWEYNSKRTVSELIKVVRENGLLPDYLDKSFDQLAATLKTGLPEVRNNAGRAHGQGAEPKRTPAYVAAYALHLVAANIVFLVEAMNHDDGAP